MRIMTRSGIWFDLLKPRVEDIHGYDIAWALSGLRRFVNHTHIPITVAQHSLIVARLCTKEKRAAAILHDAHEAYIGDIPRPLKRLVPQIDSVIRRIDHVIQLHFDTIYVDDEDVAEADNTVLMYEGLNFLNPAGKWGEQHLLGGKHSPSLLKQVGHLFSQVLSQTDSQIRSEFIAELAKYGLLKKL